MKLREALLPLVTLLASPACTSNAPSESPQAETPDAGSGPMVVVRPELGLRFQLPSDWSEVEPFAPGRDAESEVRTLALLRHPPAVRGRVAPRVELTTEPAGTGPSEAVFSRVLADLKAIGERPKVTVERAGFSARTLGSSEAADIRLRYRVGEPGVRVLQRSLLILQTPPSGDRRLISLTTSYVEGESATVVEALERMFARVELTSPAPKDTP